MEEWYDPCTDATSAVDGCYEPEEGVYKSCHLLGAPYVGYCQYCHINEQLNAVCDCCFHDYVLFAGKACCAWN
jgi:hypothetical protein